MKDFEGLEYALYCDKTNIPSWDGLVSGLVMILCQLGWSV